MAATVEDDDRVDDLPPLGSGTDEDDEGPGDERLDELDAPDTGDETVGLDAAEGPDDEQDAGELIDAGIGGEEGWTSDTDEAGDMAGAAFDDEGDEGEYGWTDDNEDAQVESWDADLEGFEADSPVVGTDSGEEGIEDHGIDETAVPEEDDDGTNGSRPSIRARREGPPDEDDAEVDLEGEDEIDLADEDDDNNVSADPPPPHDVSLDVRRVPMRGHGVYALEVTDEVIVGGDGLWHLDEELPLPLGIDSTGTHQIAAVASDPSDPATIVIGTRNGEVLRSTDGGRRFAPLRGIATGGGETCDVHAEPCGPSARLWARTGDGRLFVSDDFGDTWRQPWPGVFVRGLVVDASAGVVAFAAPATEGHSAGILRRTSDGGHTWTSDIVVPPLATGSRDAAGMLHMAACRDTLAVSADTWDGVLVSLDDGASWRVLRSLPGAGPLALVPADASHASEASDEAPAPVLYAALYSPERDRGRVVRYPLARLAPDGVDDPGPDALMLDTHDTDAAPAHTDPEHERRVVALDVRHEPGEGMLIHAAAGEVLYRARLGPEDGG